MIIKFSLVCYYVFSSLGIRVCANQACIYKFVIYVFSGLGDKCVKVWLYSLCVIPRQQLKGNDGCDWTGCIEVYFMVKI